jgi:hypothetical protein
MSSLTLQINGMKKRIHERNIHNHYLFQIINFVRRNYLTILRVNVLDFLKWHFTDHHFAQIVK